MSRPRFVRARFIALAAPLLMFGCFTAGDDGGGGGDDDDSDRGCRSDDECRLGRVCIDTDGDRDDFCEDGEECECTEPSDGSGGTSGSGTGGSSTGGRGGTTGNGGSTMGGSDAGGSDAGGSDTGGSDTGGSATGGSGTGGSATGGSGTGGSAGGCGTYCDRLVGAMCAATTEAACLTACNDLAADCAAAATALNACVANPANAVSCQAGQTVISGCDTQIDGVNRCAVCIPETNDTACGTCTKSSCCDEVGDYNLAPDIDAFYGCAVACTTQACIDACVVASPVAGAAFEALGACQDDSCPEPCICGASTSDDACDTCYKGSCCTEYSSYVLAPNGFEFESCASDCADDVCFQACIDDFPIAGNAYVAWLACIEGNCATECAL